MSRFHGTSFVVITGLSGSGKSTLAFDTLYAEGQRRYVESLSAYARQFLEQMERPNVESMEGLSPAIAIDQRSIVRSPRSTVGTVTEIYDYLRLLFARVGEAFCPHCGSPISSQTLQQMMETLLRLPKGSSVTLLSPIVRGKKGEYRKELETLRRDGFVRVRIDGQMRDLGEEIKLDKNRHHEIDVWVDRLVVKEGSGETDPRFPGDRFPSFRRESSRWRGRGHPRSSSARGSPASIAGSVFRRSLPGCFPSTTPREPAPTCSGLGTKRYFDPNLRGRSIPLGP